MAAAAGCMFPCHSGDHTHSCWHFTLHYPESSRLLQYEFIMLHYELFLLQATIILGYFYPGVSGTVLVICAQPANESTADTAAPRLIGRRATR